jgi:hypothetical protein
LLRAGWAADLLPQPVGILMETKRRPDRDSRLGRVWLKRCA